MRLLELVVQVELFIGEPELDASVECVKDSKEHRAPEIPTEQALEAITLVLSVLLQLSSELLVDLQLKRFAFFLFSSHI